MGTSTSAAQFAGKMNRIASTLPKTARNGVATSSLAGKQTIQSVASSRRVRPDSLIAGRRWATRYDIRTIGARTTALLRITGAFPLVESDTPAHTISARRAPGRRSRRKGAKALNIGGNIRASANHPGTRGKHIFRDAKKIIVNRTPPSMMAQVVTDIAKQLK